MKKITMVLITATLLYSCVKSLYPLTENEKEMIFKKELLGDWKDKDGTEYLIDTLKGSGSRKYSIVHIEKNKPLISADSSISDTSYFIGMLVNLKGNYVMDCSADMEQMHGKKMGESAANMFIPIHFFIKVANIKQNSVELSALEIDKLALLLKNKKINIRHELINKDEILLTEKSKTLQQKLIELEKFPSAYGETNRLIRIR